MPLVKKVNVKIQSHFLIHIIYKAQVILICIFIKRISLPLPVRTIRIRNVNQHQSNPVGLAQRFYFVYIGKLLLLNRLLILRVCDNFFARISHSIPQLYSIKQIDIWLKIIFLQLTPTAVIQRKRHHQLHVIFLLCQFSDHLLLRAT